MFEQASDAYTVGTIASNTPTRIIYKARHPDGSDHYDMTLTPQAYYAANVMTMGLNINTSSVTHKIVREDSLPQHGQAFKTLVKARFFTKRFYWLY